MFFNEEFIKNVENEPITGIISICDHALNKLEEINNNQNWTEEEHELLWETAAFLEAIIVTNGFQFGGNPPQPSGDTTENCVLLQSFVRLTNNHFKTLKVEQTTLLKVTSYRARYKASLKGSFCYEFSQGDLDRVQTLVNEIRENISQNQILNEAHKMRLLSRLEKLQSELHKKVSDLDRFWGMVGDAGVVLGKLGSDAKPIVDRVKEVAEIVWKTQARSEELPSSFQNPMIDSNNEA